MYRAETPSASGFGKVATILPVSGSALTSSKGLSAAAPAAGSADAAWDGALSENISASESEDANKWRRMNEPSRRALDARAQPLPCPRATDLADPQSNN